VLLSAPSSNAAVAAAGNVTDQGCSRRLMSVWPGDDDDVSKEAGLLPLLSVAEGFLQLQRLALLLPPLLLQGRTTLPAACACCCSSHHAFVPVHTKETCRVGMLKQRKLGLQARTASHNTTQNLEHAQHESKAFTGKLQITGISAHASNLAVAQYQGGFCMQAPSLDQLIRNSVMVSWRQIASSVQGCSTLIVTPAHSRVSLRLRVGLQ